MFHQKFIVMKKLRSNDYFQAITDIFIEALKEDIIPWQPKYRLKPSLPTDTFIAAPFEHYNAHTKKAYRSINCLILEMAMLKHHYEHPFWLTFKQAQTNDLTN